MPYYRRRYQKRTYRRRYARKGAFKSKVKRATVSMAETKFSDLEAAAASASASGNSVFGNTLINAPLQGVTASTRVGDQIQEVGIEIRGMIYSNTSASNDCVRLILVRDNESQVTSQPATSDILENPGGAGANYEYSVQRFVNRKRFNFLMDTCIPLNPKTYTGTTTPAALMVPFHFKVPVRRRLNLVANTGTWGAISHGGIFLLFISANGSNYPSLNATCRFYYKDV